MKPITLSLLLALSFAHAAPLALPLEEHVKHGEHRERKQARHEQARHEQTQRFSVRNIAKSDEYLAFPFVIKLGNSLVGVYSAGNSHADSARQVMIRSDDHGATWKQVDFFQNDTRAYNFTLLAGLLPPGQSAVFKAWTVKNINGGYTVATNSTVRYAGLTYAMWSRPVNGESGKMLRTGYTAKGNGNGKDTQTALFESSDGGMSWSGRSVIFATPGRRYGEADIVNTTGKNWIAVAREESSRVNPLYQSSSKDNGLTWSEPELLPPENLNGRQPNLIKTAGGSIILATSDRSGASGLDAVGRKSASRDTTGITLYRSQDYGVTWGSRTSVAPMYSTDGGQPFVNETTPDNLSVVFYAREDQHTKPAISTVRLRVEELPQTGR